MTRMRSLTLAGSIAALLFSAACSDPGDGDAGLDELSVDHEVITVPFGEIGTVAVFAKAAGGGALPFSVVSAEDCAQVFADPDEISIVPGDEICTEGIRVETEDGLMHDIKINVIDPYSMDIGDGLLISYTNEYQIRWDDSGADGGADVSLHHPITDKLDGWYPLGSDLRLTNTPPWGPACNIPSAGCSKGPPMIMVKDSLDNGVLAEPDGYTWIWNDADNGAESRFGSVWRPDCPEGYEALGFVASGNLGGPSGGWSAPPLDAVRCVAEDFVIPAEIGARFYTDSGSGGDYNLATFQQVIPQFPAINDEREPMLVGTMAGGCPSYQSPSCDRAMVNMLLVPTPVHETGGVASQPELTGYELYDTSKARFFGSVRVPFSMLGGFGRSDRRFADNQAIENYNVDDSPFYTLRREEVYTSLGSERNLTSNPIDLIFEKKKGLEEAERTLFSTKIGVEVTASGGVGISNTGSNYSIKVSTELGWENEDFTTFSTSTATTLSVPVSPGALVEVLQVATRFQAFDVDGQPALIDGIGLGALTGSSFDLVTLEYAP